MAYSRTAGRIMARPASIRAAWAFGIVFAFAAAEALDPPITSVWRSGFALFSRLTTWLCLAAAVILVAVGIGRALMRLPDRRWSRITALLLGLAGCVTALAATIAAVTPSVLTVQDYMGALSPATGPAGPGLSPRLAPTGIDESFVVGLIAQREVDREHAQRVSLSPSLSLEIWAADGEYAHVAVNGGRGYERVRYGEDAALTIHRIRDSWLAVARSSQGTHRQILAQSPAREPLRALDLLPRPLGAPPALAWMVALAPALGGALWLASRCAKRRLTQAEAALGALQYRVAASGAEDDRIAEARTHVARLEALAVLVMILLATPGLVALARGLTLSLGLA